MKLRIISLFSFLFIIITSISANNHPFLENEDVVVCGNGMNVVETSAKNTNDQLTFSFKRIYNIFNLNVSNSIMKSRFEDMNRGEIVEQYITESGEFTQHTFVSRKDDVAVIYLNSVKGSINFTLKASAPTHKEQKNTVQVKTHIKDVDNCLTIQNSLSKPITIGDTQVVGNEALLKVYSSNNKITFSGEEIKLKNADKVVIIIASKTLTTLVDSHKEELSGRISNLLSGCEINVTEKNNKQLPSRIYETLFQRHYEIHKETSKSISFTLNTGSEVDKSISEMYNKMFYKGLCSGNTQTIETNNFSALPKLSQLVKSEIQASFLYDYYLYTLDSEFLENKVFPSMIKVHEEIEKTLKSKDSFGRYIISKDNPTIEVTAHIFFYRDLISTCNILSNKMDEKMSFYQELIPQCEKIISLLPPYQIDRNEEFCQNLFGEKQNNRELPDVPQLLGLFYRNDPIIYRNYDIREACRTTIKTCIDYRKKKNINGLDAGFVQLSLSSAALGDGDTAYNLIYDSKPYWTDYSNKEIVPIITKMLVQSYYSPESNRCYVNILPAAPRHWIKGELKGAPVRGGITIRNLDWDDKEGLNATIESKSDITLDIYVRGKFVKKVELKASESHTVTT